MRLDRCCSSVSLLTSSLLPQVPTHSRWYTMAPSLSNPSRPSHSRHRQEDLPQTAIAPPPELNTPFYAVWRAAKHAKAHPPNINPFATSVELPFSKRILKRLLESPYLSSSVDASVYRTLKPPEAQEAEEPPSVLTTGPNESDGTEKPEPDLTELTQEEGRPRGELVFSYSSPIKYMMGSDSSSKSPQAAARKEPSPPTVLETLQTASVSSSRVHSPMMLTSSLKEVIVTRLRLPPLLQLFEEALVYRFGFLADVSECGHRTRKPAPIHLGKATPPPSADTPEPDTPLDANSDLVTYPACNYGQEDILDAISSPLLPPLPYRRKGWFRQYIHSSGTCFVRINSSGIHWMPLAPCFTRFAASKTSEDQYPQTILRNLSHFCQHLCVVSEVLEDLVNEEVLSSR